MTKPTELKLTEQLINALRDYPINYRLKRLRSISGYTQKELSALIGVSKAAISGWENGKNIPYGMYLERYLRVFELPTDFFVDVELEAAKNRSKK